MAKKKQTGKRPAKKASRSSDRKPAPGAFGRKGSSSTAGAASQTLSVVASGDAWQLAFGSIAVTAGNGTPVRHESKALISGMRDQLVSRGPVRLAGTEIERPKFLGLYAAFAIHHEWIKPGKDDLTLQFAERLAGDPILRDVPGPERVYQLMEYEPVYRCYREHVESLRGLAEELDQGQYRDDFDPSPHLAEAADDVAAIREMYLRLTEAERTCVMFLHAVHDGQVLAPLALVRGRCSTEEYVEAVAASQAMLHEVFGGVSRRQAQSFRKRVREDAGALLEYVKLHDGERSRSR